MSRSDLMGNTVNRVTPKRSEANYHLANLLSYRDVKESLS